MLSSDERSTCAVLFGVCMIRYDLSVPYDVLDAIEDLPRRSEAAFVNSLDSTVKRPLNATVESLFGQYPGPAVHPFEFATAKSRRWFFANIGHYVRKGKPPLGWTVQIDMRRTGSELIIYNEWPASIYVYGGVTQRQVPGHKRTGWGGDFETAAQLAQEEATNLIIEAWVMAIDGEINKL